MQIFWCVVYRLICRDMIHEMIYFSDMSGCIMDDWIIDGNTQIQYLFYHTIDGKWIHIHTKSHPLSECIYRLCNIFITTLDCIWCCFPNITSERFNEFIIILEYLGTLWKDSFVKSILKCIDIPTTIHDILHKNFSSCHIFIQERLHNDIRHLRLFRMNA